MKKISKPTEREVIRFWDNITSAQFGDFSSLIKKIYFEGYENGYKDSNRANREEMGEIIRENRIRENNI